MVSSWTADHNIPNGILWRCRRGIQNEIEGISYGKNKSEKKTSNLTKYNRAGYFFVAPFVIVFPDFQCTPVFRTLVLSFTDSKLAGMPYHFVGLKIIHAYLPISFSGERSGIQSRSGALISYYS